MGADLGERNFQTTLNPIRADKEKDFHLQRNHILIEAPGDHDAWTHFEKRELTFVQRAQTPSCRNFFQLCADWFQRWVLDWFPWWRQDALDEKLWDHLKVDRTKAPKDIMNEFCFPGVQENLTDNLKNLKRDFKENPSVTGHGGAKNTVLPSKPKARRRLTCSPLLFRLLEEVEE